MPERNNRALMTEQRMRIGIETRFMAGHMTGIGNYAFHLLSVLTASYPELEYRGFGRASWFSLDTNALQHVSKNQNKGSELRRRAPMLCATSVAGYGSEPRASRFSDRSTGTPIVSPSLERFAANAWICFMR